MKEIKVIKAEGRFGVDESSRHPTGTKKLCTPRNSSRRVAAITVRDLELMDTRDVKQEKVQRSVRSNTDAAILMAELNDKP